MAKNWKEFEADCALHLNEKYGGEKISFISKGASDSNVPDIEVMKQNKCIFSIEVKMNEAQSGQFVTLSNGSQFFFSKRNRTEKTENTELILRYINDNFDKYKNVSKTGVSIDLDDIEEKQAFERWIINYYKSKNSLFLISKHKSGEYCIVPVEKFGAYFNITCTLRTKLSGSDRITGQHFDSVKKFLEDDFKAEKFYYAAEKGRKKKHLHVKKLANNCEKLNIPGDKEEFCGDAVRYIICKKDTKKEENCFQIRTMAVTASINDKDPLSRSRQLPESHENDVRGLFIEKYGSGEFEWIGNKFMVRDNNNVSENDILEGKHYRYQIKKTSEDYVITKLSSTANPTVIYSIKLKKHQDPKDVETFINALQSSIESQ